MFCHVSIIQAERIAVTSTYVNGTVWRAMTKVGISFVKEPHGLPRSDGERPGGLALIPWREGCSATWDVTITDAVSHSFLYVAVCLRQTRRLLLQPQCNAKKNANTPKYLESVFVYH
jgi:hypothetical protein